MSQSKVSSIFDQPGPEVTNKTMSLKGSSMTAGWKNTLSSAGQEALLRHQMPPH